MTVTDEHLLDVFITTYKVSAPDAYMDADNCEAVAKAVERLRQHCEVLAKALEALRDGKFMYHVEVMTIIDNALAAYRAQYPVPEQHLPHLRWPQAT